MQTSESSTRETGAVVRDAAEQEEARQREERRQAYEKMVAEAPDLTAGAILGADDLVIERVYVREWKGAVYVKTITGAARDDFEKSILVGEETDTTNIRAKLLVHCLCDKDGNTIFTLADVEALGKKSAAGLTRVYNVASKLNRVSNADVDELAGNSGSGATVVS